MRKLTPGKAELKPVPDAPASSCVTEAAETLSTRSAPTDRYPQRDRPHESAERHVTGRAPYVDDVAMPASGLHAYTGGSDTCGRVTQLDLQAVRTAPGVVAVFTADDVPGSLDIGPVYSGDQLLARETVDYAQQPLFLVVAESHRLARQAARLAKIKIEPTELQLDVEQALAAEDFLRPSHTMQRGKPTTAIADADLQLQGRMHIGGQEHFYLEGQACLCTPKEEGGVHILSSTQHPSEVQKLVAEVLSLPINAIDVEVRRMGGGFGGKETQAAQWACLAALAARLLQRPVKMRLSRADDFKLTGKRHPFYQTYQVGFDQEGRIQAADLTVTGNCGVTVDLSDAIVDRAMFHADNAYYYPQARITGHRCRTSTVSHTAFRGFGGPQGMMLAERMLDDIARAVGRDPLDVRKLNCYQDTRAQTVYGQDVDPALLLTLMTQLESSSDYRARRQHITDFNQHSPVIKRGIALSPVKYGISFTAKHLNQAGALVHVYTDGSVHLNHGGTEMGQGLNTKIAQIVARQFGILPEQIICSSARTDKVPNTSPTAASSGTDLNGMAAVNAVDQIKQRMIDFLADHFNVDAATIRFDQAMVQCGEQNLSFAEVVQLAYLNRISLSAQGFYRTPKIHYDRDTGVGRPFFYFACGAAVAEVEVDTLTGEYTVRQVDILHDVGLSINPAIDLGQVEGGFVQGAGWLTTEELQWNDQGQLLTTGPATYKIPSIGDMPERFNVTLYESANTEKTVFRSKAVGEPPFPLAASIWLALRDACASLNSAAYAPPLDPPATPEKVLKAVQLAKAYTRTAEDHA